MIPPALGYATVLTATPSWQIKVADKPTERAKQEKIESLCVMQLPAPLLFQHQVAHTRESGLYGPSQTAKAVWQMTDLYRYYVGHVHSLRTFDKKHLSGLVCTPIFR
jgi:hypothetical protein